MPATDADLLRELESLGTEQNRKIFRRHGANEPLFGVSFANLGKLRNRIKIDHNLTKRLWASGNYDARIFAMLIADPDALTASEAEAWAKDLDCYPVTDQLAALVARSPLARKLAAKWTKARGEWVASAGWGVVAHASRRDDIPDDDFAGYLNVIRTGIHGRPNRVRHTMNGALIAIGCRNAAFKALALDAAAVIGKVEVDHGETDCKTPDAAAYIEKVYSRKK
jgi:3-methyladenine DNA glycosylase AlkD